MGKRRGGGFKGRRQEGGGKSQKGGDGGRHGKANVWHGEKPVERTSVDMEEYYKKQAIIPDGQWDEFLRAARDQLPTTFRVSPIGAFADEIKTTITRRFQDLKVDQVDLDEGDERLQPPKMLPFYPGGLAWGMSISKKVLKKTPALSDFHKFIVSQTEIGYLTRQEAVSMIPPLFLEVEPHHRVLDMCAAPGSKTSQMLEFIHQTQSTLCDPVPKGMLVANDSDMDRCAMLVHQMKRINSPALMIVNHDGQQLPLLWQRSEGDNRKEVRLAYDRILADVPCTGDGTMRKNVDVWRKWSVNQAMGLHKLQLQILSRGVEMLAPGGIIVYSTCSMNPCENEAIVAAALAKYKGTLELVDVSKELPDLKRMPGLHSWFVRDRKDKDTWYASMDDVPEQFQKHSFAPSMWPPTKEEAEAMRLERCVRVLPHQQDTGAFFICKLRKTGGGAPEKGEEAEAKPADAGGEPAKGGGEAPAAAGEGEGKEGGEGGEEGGDKEGGKAKKGRGGKGPKENSKKYEVLTPMKDAATRDRLVDFFGLGDKFPKDQLMTSSDQGNKVYFVSSAVKEFLVSDVKSQLKVVGAGVKLFEKNPTKNEVFDFRLRQEGVQFILPFMTKRVLRLPMADFQNLLHNRNMLMDNLSEGKHKDEIKGWEGGCVLFMLDAPQFVGNKSVFLTGWRGAMQLTLFVSKAEQEALCHFFPRPPKAEGEAGAAKAKGGGGGGGAGGGGAKGEGAGEGAEGGDAKPMEAEGTGSGGDKEKEGAPPS